ncbi:MAG: sulfatase-like hydrolase/transferase, partial [Planctomycetes bacterium]|nr:sulfatase-like hydrolase/transferase [Planctomycetota bacterium]
DAQVGRILEALREAGLEEDTIIVFAGDHGLAIGSHGLFGKQNLYDCSMRTPMIFAGPGIPQGKTSDAFCYLLDIYPTLGDLAKVQTPDGSDGKSLVPVLKGDKTQVRDSLFTAYRQFERSVRDDGWHMIVYPHLNKTQLFDLQNDPHETKNLAADPAHAKQIELLTEKLKDWQKQLGDKQPLRSDKPMAEEFDFSKVPPLEKKKKEKKASQEQTPVAAPRTVLPSPPVLRGRGAGSEGAGAPRRIDAQPSDTQPPHPDPLPLSTGGEGATPVKAKPNNIITPGKVEMYPTYAAIGIEVAYTGDDNDNAQASFVWRKASESTWRNGVDMTFDRKRKLIWASIWPLEQDETIAIQITFEDPDAKDQKQKWNGVHVTRKFNFTPQGRTFYVAPTGSDADAGSKDKPFKTFANASKQLQPGDTLLAMSGVYKEGDLLQGLKGTADKPIVIAAAKDEKPILDSSLVIAAKSGAWKDLGDGVFVTKPNVITEFANYVAQDKSRMFVYPSLADLKADKQKAKRAWYWDAKEKLIYVRTGTGKDPDEHNYNVAQHTYGLHMTRAQHVVIRGLTMRYYGAVAVRLSEGATGCVLYENMIHNSAGAIFMKSETTRDNAIWKNFIYESGAGDFSWTAHYAIEYGNQAIYCDKAGRGNSFCHNQIIGFFDLISVESWKNPDKLQYNRDCDIMFNSLSNAVDDAIEVDGGGVNMRIHGNWIAKCQTGISLAPVERGPVYVTRNTVTFFGLFIKFNVGGTVSHGWTYIYHNSGYSLTRGPDGGTGVSFAPNLPCTNKVLKNNIIMVNEWCVRAWRKDNALDYNCYHHIPKREPRRFQAGKNVHNTIADFAKATGQETHGLYADPMFVMADDAGAFLTPAYEEELRKAGKEIPRVHIRGSDMRLRPGSPCIDRGVVLRGINENFKGKAPDIGAYEFDK